MLQIYSNVISNNTLISLVINEKARLMILNKNKIQPPRKNPPSSFIDLLDFFQRPLVYSNLHIYYKI